MTTTEGTPMTATEAHIRNALADIDKALREPENYDQPDMEEIRALQASLRARLQQLTTEQETAQSVFRIL